jgi:hypothetical protein
MMLLVSAFDLEWQRGKPNTFHSEKYTKECIRLLRDRVQDPVSGASNQTIGAVATLASLEVSVKPYVSAPSIYRFAVRPKKHDGGADAY